jgi:hypothetical protein
MPKTRISEYSTTNTDNSDIESINIAEGCAPSGINNAIRELMVHLKEFQTGASGDAFTFAGGVLISGSLNTATGAMIMTGANNIALAAGAVGTPSLYANGDTNTGIFFPAADTIAFAEGGAEAMRINDAGEVLVGGSTSINAANGCLTVQRTNDDPYFALFRNDTSIVNGNRIGNIDWYVNDTTSNTPTRVAYILGVASGDHSAGSNPTDLTFATTASGSATVTERMRIDSSGKVGIGTTSPSQALTIGNGGKIALVRASATNTGFVYTDGNGTILESDTTNSDPVILTSPGTGGTIRMSTAGTERARITSDGYLLVGKTTTSFATAGSALFPDGRGQFVTSGNEVLAVNRLTNDGNLVEFYQATTLEGAISVSGNTVTYGSFCGGHWSQLQEGRGYNPEIPRGTVMSSIGEMAEWKSVTWTETIEHPAVLAVEAKEAVLDEEGNVVEPAVEAVEGKDAWTELISHRENYLGNLPIGATFEEDGFTKTVVDDGNERLPKVKISDVVGDKAVYGVFQTWDEAQDMLVSSLGAFVVRIASGVTVQIGDLLESNGDGCAKVQDDDVIRSKTIGKVTSTVATATYPDGSYTVPCVLYCG